MELIKRFKMGDENVFEELVKRYQQRVYNTTYRMLGSPEDASDMAQETFLRVYHNLPKFRENSSFSTWLFKIATNICRDYLRKEKRDFTRMSYEENFTERHNSSILDIPGENESPEEISVRLEIQKEVQKLINNLPYEYKEVIILREFQGFSYEEMANILEISIGTVKSRLSRARENLRQDLKKLVTGVKNNEA